MAMTIRRKCSYGVPDEASTARCAASGGGEQIVWDDGDWITLDGRASCPRGSEHRLATPPGQ